MGPSGMQLGEVGHSRVGWGESGRVRQGRVGWDGVRHLGWGETGLLCFGGRGYGSSGEGLLHLLHGKHAK